MSRLSANSSLREPPLFETILWFPDHPIHYSLYGQDGQTKTGDAMSACPPERFCSVPSATGAVARLASARLREFGKDIAAILAEVGARPEQVNDDTIRLEVPKQIRILELAAQELQDELFGFHLARNFDLREIGLVYKLW